MTIAPASSTTAVSCPAGPYTYTGAAQMPCSAMVTGASLNLTPTPSYANNTDAGTATASYTFAGDANHTGSSDSKTFTIGPASSTTTVSCPATAQTYAGAPLNPCTASYSGAGGLSGSLTPTYSDNINVGTATARASFTGDANHTGSSATGSFPIGQAPSTVTVTCTAGAPYTYTGSAQTPCTAAATGVGMSPVDVSGSLSYANNLAAGAATAAASWAGDPNHLGSTGTGGFTIERAASAVTVTCTAGAPYTYTGSAQTPCTAAATGVGMSPVDVSGSLSYANNLAAGAATAAASWAGDPNHLGSTGTGGFTIERAASAVTVTCTAGAPYTYTGSAQTPCTAAATGVGMSPVDVSGSLSYANNLAAGAATAAASWAGDPNHLGSTGTGGFTIERAASAVTVTCTAGAPYTYTGSAQTPCTAGATGVGMSPVDVSGSLSYANNLAAGAATAAASWAGDPNHTGSTGTGGFTIERAASAVTVTCTAGAPYTYTGSAQTPCTAAATGVGMSPVDVSGSLSYANNLAAGAATAAASWAGDPNHLGSTGTGGFTIERAASAVTVTCTAGAPYTYTGSAQTPCTAAATGVGMSPVDVSGSLSYANNLAAGAATAAASWAGDPNHLGSTGTGGFTIERAASAVTVTCTAGASYTYTGSAQTPCTAAATGAGGLNVGVTPVAYTSNTNVGTAGGSATYGGDVNHFGSTGTGSFAIGKAASYTVVTFEAAPYTYRGTAFTATAQVSGVGGLSAAVTPVVYTGDCANVTSANGCTATATYGGDQNHEGSSGSKSITLTQAILTVTADNKTMVLSGPLPVLTGTLTGVKNGDGITASYSTSANGTSVGVFPIVPSLNDPNAKLGNYTVAPTNGTLTVQYAQGGICLASPGHQILQPVNADGSSVFKKGSTIPVKFRVCDANANPIGGAGQVVTVWNQNWPVLYWKSSGAGAIDEEVLSTTPDTQFRWDDTAQQWVFNLNSKNLTAGMIYTYRIYLNDTSNIEFKFGVK